MESFYEINVAKCTPQSPNGVHLFSTGKRLLTSLYDLSKVYPVIHHKFPRKDGWVVTVTYWHAEGHEVSAKTLLKMLRNHEED